MHRALRLARRGLGRVEPNPMVGAVLARGGQVLAEGYHHKFGGPHAEAQALHQARQRGIDPAGCDLFVSLEPCCHQGKTPPCTGALIEAGLGRVFAAMIDPAPTIAGRGIDALKAAGIRVEVGLCEPQARDLNAPYLKRTTTGLPWVIVKWAQTLDGRTATADGHSRWISNPTSRRRVHQLRARVDAVMVGIGTALVDDPQLTARTGRVRRVARRVVVDPQLRLPHNAVMLQSNDPPVTLAVHQQIVRDRPARLVDLESRGVECVGLPPADDDPPRLNLRPLMRHLVQHHQATNVLVEGGATLAGSLFKQGLVDQVLAFVAPKVLGDDAALAAVRGLTCTKIADAPALSLWSATRVEDDVLLDYRVQAH